MYGSSPPPAVSTLSTTIYKCLDDVVSWASSNRLQLNPTKTEVMWCATSRSQHQLPSSKLQFSGVSVAPVGSVEDLGIHIDADLSMWTHVLRTVSQCFGALRQLRQIRWSVPTATLQMLVVSLVLCRLDLGNSSRHSVLSAPVAWWCRCSSCLQSAVGSSTFLHLGSGINCQETLFRCRHFQFSGADF